MKPALFLALILLPSLAVAQERREMLERISLELALLRTAVDQQTADIAEIKRLRDSSYDRWQQRFPFLKRATRYKSATMTQELPQRRPVSKFTTAAIWHQPGGMLGIKGWKSDLYRYVPHEVRTIEGVSVWNGDNFQVEQGYTRRYSPGTFFVDVLSNAASGKPFEVRVLEKRDDGTWDRYIASKSVQDRPKGYTGLNFTCAECHSKFVGTGSYGGPLVAGSDGVFSDPVPELESRAP